MIKTALSSVNYFTGYEVSAHVGLLCLRTRMCYKNTQFILIIKFKIMIPLNIHQSSLNDIYERFFLNCNCLLSHCTPLKTTSPLSNIFLGYICGWIFGILGTVPEVQAPSQRSHFDFLRSGRSYCITFIVKRASSQGQWGLSPTLGSGGR